MIHAVEEFIESLHTLPVLIHPNYDNSLVVSKDGSKRAVGVVLSQLDDNGCEHPIPEQRPEGSQDEFLMIEREALGIVFALKKFLHYLL